VAACALPAWSDATGLRWRSKYRKAEEGKAVTRVVGAADRLQATACCWHNLALFTHGSEGCQRDCCASSAKPTPA
jgi:hypothetical protein